MLPIWEHYPMWAGINAQKTLSRVFLHRSRWLRQNNRKLRYAGLKLVKVYKISKYQNCIGSPLVHIIDSLFGYLVTLLKLSNFLTLVIEKCSYDRKLDHIQWIDIYFRKKKITSQQGVISICEFQKNRLFLIHIECPYRKFFRKLSKL